jgi:Nif-specific regulatory protein
MQPRLTIEVGEGASRSYSLEPGRTYTLGRHHKNAIVLEDEHASRWHAEVYFADGRWLIRDSGTKNGTCVNGIPIQQPMALENGQLIGIGRTCLRFSAEVPTAAGSGKAAFASEGTAPAACLVDRVDSDSFSSLLERDETVLQRDELTVLCSFMAESVGLSCPQALIQKALETIQGQTGASVLGFLSLDQETLLPKVILPLEARVDETLSRRLTQAVQQQRRVVWLGAQPDLAEESDSLGSFVDALCLPLLRGERPLGAVHVYQANRLFTEREVRFCEILTGHLANCLHLLRMHRTLEAENSRLRGQRLEVDELIGNSSCMTTLRQTITRLAAANSPILIVGESGVGKELVALALHRQSPRREGPLVCVNCAAISPTLFESELFGHSRGAFTGAQADHAGLFQQADEGTLFLDEIGELPLELQAKLLRVLEGKGFRPIGARAEVQVDVRIVAATHRDLEREVKNGRFRHDLYFRLEGLRILVPPLRERLEDVPDLARYFVKRLATSWGHKVKLSPEALRRLGNHGWPGNIRQLRSVLENAVALSDKEVLEPADLRLPEATPSEKTDTLQLEQLEAWAVRQALERTGGNLSRAAELLGVVRETLKSKMKKYGIARRATEEDADGEK